MQLPEMHGTLRVNIMIIENKMFLLDLKENLLITKIFE